MYKFLDSDIKQKLKESECSFYFVMSYPRSDMGKGTVVSYLAKVLGNFSIIKYDGLLNTNRNNRHIEDELEKDDFHTYKSVAGLSATRNNYMILGDLLSEFISSHGEGSNHLSFRPNFAYFVIESIYERWLKLGKPKNLVIEIGGIIRDDEVLPFMPFVFAFFSQILKDRIKLILLTEVGVTHDSIKTKGVQEAVKEFSSRGLAVDYLLVREPKEFNNFFDRVEAKNIIIKKIFDNTNIYLEDSQVELIPYLEKTEMGTYEQVMRKLIHKKVGQSIFLGTSNKGKIADWKRYFPYLDLVTPADINQFIEVEEGIVSIFENAEKKAREWSMLTDMITACDDTGFFIPSINGRPGVQVKTFAGELPEDRTNQEYVAHLFRELGELNSRECYFESAVAFAKQGKIIKVISYRISGKIIPECEVSKVSFEAGFPIGAVFIPHGSKKVWSSLTDDEKRLYDKHMQEEIESALLSL